MSEILQTPAKETISPYRTTEEENRLAEELLKSLFGPQSPHSAQRLLPPPKAAHSLPLPEQNHLLAPKNQ